MAHGPARAARRPPRGAARPLRPPTLPLPGPGPAALPPAAGRQARAARRAGWPGQTPRPPPPAGGAPRRAGPLGRRAGAGAASPGQSRRQWSLATARCGPHGQRHGVGSWARPGAPGQGAGVEEGGAWPTNPGWGRRGRSPRGWRHCVARRTGTCVCVRGHREPGRGRAPAEWRYQGGRRRQWPCRAGRAPLVCNNRERARTQPWQQAALAGGPHTPRIPPVKCVSDGHRLAEQDRQCYCALIR